MSFHRNAKLGLGGRCALVGAIEGGLSIRAAAARFDVSPATAHRWWRRWREADEERDADCARLKHGLLAQLDGLDASAACCS
jgi:transposase-like protein